MLQKHSKIVSERVEISREMDQLNSANTQLRTEIDRFETQVSFEVSHRSYTGYSLVTYRLLTGLIIAVMEKVDNIT